MLPLQCPCSGLTCFSMTAEAKLRGCSWDPTQAAGTTGQLNLQTSQARLFSAHSTSPPPAASLPCFNADYRVGICQEMPCFSVFLPLKNFQRDSSEKERNRERERSFREHHTGQELIFLQFPEVFFTNYQFVSFIPPHSPASPVCGGGSAFGSPWNLQLCRRMEKPKD